MLLATNIYFNRGGKKILDNINLSLSPKKIIHLVGNNGVGKTTLLKILSNNLNPSEGELYWNGKNIKKNPYEYYKNISFIMDSQTSHPSLTVKENIYFWKKLFSSEIKVNEIDSILDLIQLSEYKNSITNTLSYGELKKLELLRLIIEQKKLWILDEPYLGLDQNSTKLINQTIIKHVNNTGIVIFTSHKAPEITNLETFYLEKNA